MSLVQKPVSRDRLHHRLTVLLYIHTASFISRYCDAVHRGEEAFSPKGLGLRCCWGKLICSHLHSLRDAGTPATQGPPPNNDTVTYSVLQKRHMVRGQSYRKLWGWGAGVSIVMGLAWP